MDPEAIGFRNSTFTWSKSVGGAPLGAPVTPSRRHFRLRVDGDLFFHKGCLNLIVGPTGSGKTSLLLALLGELHFSPPGPDSWYNIPRGGGVAYSAQEPWILNETIKVCHTSRITWFSLFHSSCLQENILFGQPLDVDRYKKGRVVTAEAEYKSGMLIYRIFKSCISVPWTVISVCSM
jgi:hypothetical protein